MSAGRGLSRLERWILEQAASRDPLDRTKGVLYQAEILAGFYGFPTTHQLYNSVGDHYYGQHFSRAAIGAGRYRSGQVSVSRSCGRLEARGLVTCCQGRYSRWAGVRITEEGRAVIVDTVARVQQCQLLREEAPELAP